MVVAFAVPAVCIGVPAYAATHETKAHPNHPAHPAHPAHPVHPAQGRGPATFAASSSTPSASSSSSTAPVDGSAATTASEAASDTVASSAASDTVANGAASASPTSQAASSATPSAGRTGTASPTTSARTTDPAPTPSASTAELHRPDHIVIVVEENHSFDQLATLPYSSALMAGGATLTQSYAITHPSQPNYLALWSGSTQGVTDSSCPHDFGSTSSLGSQLLQSGLSVAAYSEGLPSAGYAGCANGAYVRRHNPVADFGATSGPAHNLPFSAFPTDFTKLPTVSLVVPDLNHDMHDGSVETGDAWLREHLGAYATWAKTHNSLLIVTADEDDKSSGNRILTVLTGEHVQSGVSSSRRVDHYGLLHTVEDAYGLPHLGPASPSISGIWR
jgi:acid phosphatase